MSWESKTDYCGLEVATKLLCKSGSANKTAQYLEKHGADGAYAATKVFGERSAPTNAYTVADDVTLTGKALGAITSVLTKKYALEKVSWTTGADAEPVFTASAQEVESGATAGSVNTFALPEFTVSPDQVAQVPAFKFSGDATATAAFTVSGSGCEVTGVTVEASCKVGTNDKGGVPQAHDVTNGHIVVNVTIGQYGETEPTLTAGTGWDISSPLTVDDPDSDTPTWTATLTRALAKTTV